jgi:hypothetical protein
VKHGNTGDLLRIVLPLDILTGENFSGRFNKQTKARYYAGFW